MLKSVLVADDCAATRRLVRQLFEASGWEVVGEAENGKQAVLMATDLEPAVVTLDIAMPVMDGIQAAKRLMAEAPHTLIIMCTAYESNKGLQTTLRVAGIRTLVSKYDAIQSLVPTAERLNTAMAFLRGTL
jgi:two-component system, chemotaxis family, chemotaxis protein CheY